MFLLFEIQCRIDLRQHATFVARKSEVRLFIGFSFEFNRKLLGSAEKVGNDAQCDKQKMSFYVKLSSLDKF